jgi:hypothetical protein
MDKKLGLFSQKTLEENSVEVKKRTQKETNLLKLDNLKNLI